MLQSKTMNNSDATVDLLLIGPITKDLIDQSRESAYTLGGTVTFAAITALRLGRIPTILSSVADDTDLSELSSKISLHILPSAATIYRKIYDTHASCCLVRWLTK